MSSRLQSVKCKVTFSDVVIVLPRDNEPIVSLRTDAANDSIQQRRGQGLLSTTKQQQTKTTDNKGLPGAADDAFLSGIS
ncbi:hypothetical protein PoB_003442000 [Plakobranchus ocellatus]|uniref:Uncharacterized protein n=1 Tax=Plakobranchus ocellatus TaxID=259542 RepID=A0AAV4AIB5_9GAST|nr:hypothetical protein PoB_003442000 [Plakobranchus ocellatus]